LGGWRWLMPEPDAARLADDTDSTTGDDARR
jgi:hypothetical protein